MKSALGAKCSSFILPRAFEVGIFPCMKTESVSEYRALCFVANLESSTFVLDNIKEQIGGLKKGVALERAGSVRDHVLILEAILPTMEFMRSL